MADMVKAEIEDAADYLQRLYSGFFIRSAKYFLSKLDVDTTYWYV